MSNLPSICHTLMSAPTFVGNKPLIERPPSAKFGLQAAYFIPGPRALGVRLRPLCSGSTQINFTAEFFLSMEGQSPLQGPGMEIQASPPAQAGLDFEEHP